MPPRQSRFANWLPGIALGASLIMSALAFAYSYGSQAKAIDILNEKVAAIEQAKLGERLSSIEATLQLIVRGLGLRPVAP